MRYTHQIMLPSYLNRPSVSLHILPHHQSAATEQCAKVFEGNGRLVVECGGCMLFEMTILHETSN